jgi:hypothetical protein
MCTSRLAMRFSMRCSFGTLASAYPWRTTVWWKEVEGRARLRKRPCDARGALVPVNWSGRPRAGLIVLAMSVANMVEFGFISGGVTSAGKK